ncbi:Bacterial regulatory protein, luxR family [Bythopirellula goksoeyrii]|uniref:Bacterial regulatory protein, luxR family n=2 Tax=Bythopirellula goksoeyrii TaxID=1400387 RepID=A0A5B9QC20_9BACT|nr:Bacterial regulatory protein, luxR family [Bythopirellula goksoeyrii]
MRASLAGSVEADSNRMKPHLSPRQAEVVRLRSLGCDVTETAAILGISKHTVLQHRAAAMEAFGTHKAALLTRVAIKHGFTSINDKLTLREKRKCGRKDDGWN